MKKKITFEIKTEASDKTIESYLRCWIRDNFRFGDSVRIKIEDVK